MLNICTKIVSVLTADSTLTQTVNPKNISVGPIDVVVEKQLDLTMPQVNIHPISESVQTVPLNAKETRVQMDIWSRNSELEAQQIYERVLVLLNFQTYNQNGSWIAWQRLDSMGAEYVTELRLWRISADFRFWSVN